MSWLLPNGWPQPTFMSTYDDGSFNIEWCFGDQGADNSWRVMFCWSPSGEVMACWTDKVSQECEERPEYVLKSLDKFLKVSVQICEETGARKSV